MSGIKGLGGVAGRLLRAAGTQAAGLAPPNPGKPGGPEGSRSSTLSAATGLPRADIKALSKRDKAVLDNASKQFLHGTIMNQAMTNMGIASNQENSEIQNAGKIAMGIQSQVNNWMETLAGNIKNGGKPPQGG